jgi:hypothetical protein
MQSVIVPGFLYKDVSSDITENDLDVVSDLWTIDGREVYRGSKDPRYTHANVYWLYSENLERVGLSEHSIADQAEFHVLWFRDTDFGTYLQEDGWETGDDIWSRLPKHTFDRFLNEGWTVPEAFLEQCLHGPVRVFTPDMLEKIPIVYTCSVCGKRSLKRSVGCTLSATPLDFPETEKVFFIDSDMIMYRPPMSSRIWDLLIQLPKSSHDDGSNPQVSQEEEKPQQESLSLPAQPLVAETPLHETPLRVAEH